MRSAAAVKSDVPELRAKRLGNTQVFLPPSASSQKEPNRTPAGATRARFAFGLRPLQRPRVAACRTVRTAPRVQLISRVQPDGTGALVFRGVSTCGSVHSCPQCAAAIMGERSRELVQALDSHSRDATALVTLTLRHHAGIPLDVLRTLLNRAWSEMFAGRKGQAFRDELAVFGHIRSAEQTYGDNGWHPHLHCLMFFESTPAEGWEQLITERWLACVAVVYKRLWDKAIEGLEPDADPVKICRVLGKRFSRPDLRTGCERFRAGLARMGGLMAITPSEERAVHAELVNHEAAATYLAKLGCELTGITSKFGKPGHYTHWQIGHHAAAGETWAKRLWTEHSAAMVYSRQLTWSRGLRDRLGLKPERPDEEVAAEQIPEEGAIDVPLGQFVGEEWDLNVKHRKQLFIADLHERYAAGLAPDNLEGPIMPSAKPVAPAPVWLSELRNAAAGRARMRERFTAQREKETKADDEMKLNRADRILALEELSHHMSCDLGFAPF